MGSSDTTVMFGPYSLFICNRSPAFETRPYTYGFSYLFLPIFRKTIGIAFLKTVPENPEFQVFIAFIWDLFRCTMLWLGVHRMCEQKLPRLSCQMIYF